MPDITHSSHAAISQALTQLSQLAPTSEAARKGVEVLVQHLAGGDLRLNKNTVLQHKTVLLANPEIKGALAEGQIHQVKLSLENPASLVFFSQTSAKSTSIISLTEQQLQTLLRLPAKQLLPNSLQAVAETINKLPVLNAVVLPASPPELSKEQLSTQISAGLLKPQTPPNAANFQAILNLSLTDSRPPIDIALPLKQLNQFAVGDKVTLAITPKGNNWQLSIVQNSREPQSGVFEAAVRATSTPEIKTQNSILSPLLATPIIKASLREFAQTKLVNFDLSIKPVLQQLSKINHENNQGLIQKLQALPIDKISLQIKPNGEIDLALQNTKPVANITVNKEMAQALAPLKLPNQQALTKQLNVSAETNKQGLPPSQVAPQIPNTETLSSMKQAEANLLAAVQQTPSTQSVISPSFLTSKAQQMNLVQSLLRIVQARAEPPAGTLQSIETALTDVEFFKGATEQSSKQLVEQVLQQIKQSLPQGKDQDANQIRQLLSTPALNLSALQMVSPTSSQGLMSGLVTLLQMSLSARLARNQATRTEHITTTLNNVLSDTGKAKPSVTPKAMGEMAQLEQKHQLMKEIGRLLSGHQSNKLSNAEQMIQGQDTFYYNLPSALGGTIKDIELLIKREENNKENSPSDEKNNKTWQLTMKLAVGEMGELLTKAKLRDDTLEINFYASNETVKIQVMNYLPLLRRKFDSLGIEVSKSQCQLGKIPDTLQQRPYHMFQAKA